jgi:hypothetical protein
MPNKGIKELDLGAGGLAKYMFSKAQPSHLIASILIDYLRAKIPNLISQAFKNCILRSALCFSHFICQKQLKIKESPLMVILNVGH